MSLTENPSPETAASRYGCERFGRLTRAMLHRPTEALGLIDHGNHRQWLFDAVPDVGRFVDEHDRYRELLEGCGVEVLELADWVRESRPLMRRLPNLTYLHDTAVVSSRGAMLSTMAGPRRGEEAVVREALGNLDVPILSELTEPDDAFEGCLMLSPETLLVADTERHTRATIARFVPRALEWFGEVIVAEIPKARRFMHPDTIYNRVDHRLALVYSPAFRRAWLHTAGGAVREIDFADQMRERGIELVEVSDNEQARLACSFVPLEPGVMIHYDTALDRSTRRELERRGVELVLFHPEAMIAGGGSLRCLTLRLHRNGDTGSHA